MPDFKDNIPAALAEPAKWVAVYELPDDTGEPLVRRVPVEKVLRQMSDLFLKHRVVKYTQQDLLEEFLIINWGRLEQVPPVSEIQMTEKVQHD